MVWESQERRRFPRLVFPCNTVVGYPIYQLASHTESITQTENISAGGIKLILEERLNVQTPVSLELFFEKDSPTKCQGRVVWVKKVNPIEMQGEPIIFDTGIEFFDTGIEFIELHDYVREYIRRTVKLLSYLKKKA